MYEIGKHTVHAEYADKTGNPFWDALPQMLGAQELFDRIRSYPTLPDNWQSLPAPERRMLVQRIHTIFHPFAYAYDLYESCDTGDFCYIAPRVIVNHGGTVLVKEPIDFGGADRINLTEDTSPNFLGGAMRVHDFMAASLDELRQYSEEPQLGGM